MNAYKRYLKSITNNEKFHIAFGNLARSARGWLDLGMEVQQLPELINTDLEAAYTLAASMLHKFYNKPCATLSVEDRQDEVELKKFLKRSYLRRLRKTEFYDDFVTCEEIGSEEEGEQWMPIIHGGDLGRVQAALYHGRGYHTENYMGNPRTKMTEQTGLMFHSSYSGRADYYARCAASQRVGIKAILVAMVQRKYLFHNQGDEYSLPTWHYDKMRNARVVTELQDEYYDIEDYYNIVYKRFDKETPVLA